MRKTEQELDNKVRERFEVMAVRWANLLKFSAAQHYADLPPGVRDHIEALQYSDIIRPLILSDYAAGMGVRQLSIKYGRTASTIQECYLNRIAGKEKLIDLVVDTEQEDGSVW